MNPAFAATISDNINQVPPADDEASRFVTQELEVAPTREAYDILQTSIGHLPRVTYGDILQTSIGCPSYMLVDPADTVINPIDKDPLIFASVIPLNRANQWVLHSEYDRSAEDLDRRFKKFIQLIQLFADAHDDVYPSISRATANQAYLAIATVLGQGYEPQIAPDGENGLVVRWQFDDGRIVILNIDDDELELFWHPDNAEIAKIQPIQSLNDLKSAIKNRHG